MRSTKVYFGKNILLIFAISLLFAVIIGVPINAEISDNTTFNKARSVSVNCMYEDNLISSSDVNYYSFTLSQSGCVSITFSHDYIDRAGSFWSLGLYDGNENQIVYYSYEGRSSAAQPSAKIGLPKGTYYVRVKSGIYFMNANYNFRVNFDDDPNWEKEYNETFYTANQILTNNTMHGSIQKNNDIDRYKFMLPEPGYITLSFSHEYIDKVGDYWHSILYDINEKKIAEYRYAGRSSDISNSAQIGLPAGTYYLEIRDSIYRSDIQYDFCINYTSSLTWEKEFNETAYTASPISVGRFVNGSICRSNDIDFFRVQISEPTYYTINFKHSYIDNASSWWIVNILSSENSNVNTSYFYGSLISDKSAQIYLSKGTYYVRVLSGNAIKNITYSLRIDKHIHNYNIVQSITRATLSRNGQKVMQCSCGAIGKKIPIYYPKRIKLSSTSFSYNGKQKKPSVLVEGADGKRIPSSNYVVKYEKGFKNVGRYYIKITFKGNYSGSKKKYFSILPQTTRIARLNAITKGFTIQIKKQRVQTTGYQIQYSLNSNFKKSKIKTIKKNTQTSLKIKGLKGKKTYFVRVRTYKIKGNKKFYSAWSTVKTVKTKK